VAFSWLMAPVGL